MFSRGSEVGICKQFQTVGAATEKLRRPSSVLVRGTSISRHSAERRCARSEMSEAGMETCLEYAGPVPRIVEGGSSNLI